MSKLHPHIKKHIKDVILSETRPNGKPSRWKEELIKAVEEDIIESLSDIESQAHLDNLIITKMAEIKQQVLLDLDTVSATIKQIPLDLLKKFNS